jgi:hypothetical protein
MCCGRYTFVFSTLPYPTDRYVSPRFSRHQDQLKERTLLSYPRYVFLFLFPFVIYSSVYTIYSCSSDFTPPLPVLVDYCPPNKLYFVTIAGHRECQGWIPRLTSSAYKHGLVMLFPYPAARNAFKMMAVLGLVLYQHHRTWLQTTNSGFLNYFVVSLASQLVTLDNELL